MLPNIPFSCLFLAFVQKFAQNNMAVKVNDNSKSTKQHSKSTYSNKSTYCNTLVSMANRFDKQLIMVWQLGESI
jgi:hypothetical protein